MLVLSRKIGEQVVIGEAIDVVVLAIRGSHVKLGLTAPPAVVERLHSRLREPSKAHATLCVRAAADSFDKTTEADAVRNVINEILARPEHVWFEGAVLRAKQPRS